MISVIIPVYNNAQTIKNTLDSIWGQTYRDYEVMVIDDASTDSTIETVDSLKTSERFIKTQTKMTLVSMTCNSGPAAARNRGMKETCGDYTAFLDGDDIWMPEKLEHQIEIMRNNPDAGMVCASVQTIGVDEPLKDNTGNQSLTDVKLADFIYQNPIATSSVLIKKSVFNDVGGFDEQFRGPEDYDLWMRVALKYRIIKSDQTLSYYRSRSGSLSMDDRRFLPQVLRVLEKAFNGGVLKEYTDMKKSAVANQYWNASWMAYNRNARLAAIRHLIKGWVLSYRGKVKLDRKWFPLLFRYVFMKRYKLD